MQRNYVKQLAERVVELRNAAHWDQQKLANMANISTKALSQIENGRVATTIEMVGKIADALGMSVGEILTDKGRPPIEPRIVQHSIQECADTASGLLLKIARSDASASGRMFKALDETGAS